MATFLRQPSPSSLLFRNLLLTNMPIISRCLSSSGPLLMRPAPVIKDKDSNYSYRCSLYSTNINHHQYFPAKGPLLMRPAANVGANGEIYDQLYDPLTGNYVLKERNKWLPDTTKIFASSRGWVGFVDPSRDCSLYLVNPTHDGHDVRPIQLPTIETFSFMRGVKRRLSSSSSSDLSVGTFYVADDSNEIIAAEYSPVEVVSRLLKGLILTADASDPGCKVVMIVFGGVLAYCKPGIDYVWMHPDLFFNYDYDKAFPQAVYSTKDKKLFTLVHSWHKTFSGRDQYGIQFRDASVEPPSEGSFAYDWNRLAAEKTYLVVDEHSGDLFLVYKLHPSSSTSSSGQPLCLNLEIYRLRPGGQSLCPEMVTSIGDLAFFIGPYECFALSANDFPQIQPNSIYMVHNELEGERYSSAAVIYNLRDHSITPFICPYGSCKLEQGAFWLAPSS